MQKHTANQPRQHFNSIQRLLPRRLFFLCLLSGPPGRAAEPASAPEDFTTYSLEVLIGHNLLDNKHNEFSDEIYKRAENEVRRSLYGRITWEF